LHAQIEKKGSTVISGTAAGLNFIKYPPRLLILFNYTAIILSTQWRKQAKK
jgi:hypothetical protein